MVLFRDARVHPADPRQVAAHKPTCTADEFPAYVWHVRQDGWNKDEPLKEQDDGMDTARYAAQAAELSGGFGTFKLGAPPDSGPAAGGAPAKRRRSSGFATF